MARLLSTMNTSNTGLLQFLECGSDKGLFGLSPLFLGLIATKLVCKDDFYNYLVALGSGFRYCDPFLYLISFNFGPNKGLLKSLLFVILHFRVK